MTKHSPEPWLLDKDGYIVDAQGHLRAFPHGSGDDRRRIVACVNFCTGIDTEILEQNLLASIRANIAELNEFIGNSQREAKS